ncbi:MAG: hypothetical protein C0432_04375 [Candidatus Puniceispirillum sp.]|nr:hypothetical protein [Candidatus Pelagibacter sp.]MBA4283511.1 hypothetical protein [Candidatus Puniceispirillum sp.]
MKNYTIKKYLSLIPLLTSFSYSGNIDHETMNPLLSSIIIEPLLSTGRLAPLSKPSVHENTEYDGDDDSNVSDVSELTLSQHSSSERPSIKHDLLDLESPSHQSNFPVSLVSQDSEESNDYDPVHINRTTIVMFNVEPDADTDLNSTIFSTPIIMGRQNVSHQDAVVILDIEPDTDLSSTVFREPIRIEMRKIIQGICYKGSSRRY